MVSDRDHVTEVAVPDLRILAIVLSLFLILITLLAAPLSAQSRGQVQVAARVVTTGPSQQALALKAAAVGVHRTSLARVRVVRETPREPRNRVVEIDFLRN